MAGGRLTGTELPVSWPHLLNMSPQTAKSQAKRLADYLLRTQRLRLSHSHSLEAISAIHGYPDWNTFSASLGVSNNRERAPIVAEKDKADATESPSNAGDDIARLAYIDQCGVVNAFDRGDGLIDLFADNAMADRARLDWSQVFRGGSFANVKLELETLIDEELFPMAEAREIRNLNLKGNWGVTGRVLAHLPTSIGLVALDVARTSVDNGDISSIVRFPKLRTVWGPRKPILRRNALVGEISGPRHRVSFNLLDSPTEGRFYARHTDVCRSQKRPFSGYRQCGH